VEQLLNSEWLREELVASGLENVARFRPESVAASYAELYTQMLKPS
jgi:hypothetical protein